MKHKVIGTPEQAIRAAIEDCYDIEGIDIDDMVSKVFMHLWAANWLRPVSTTKK